MDVDAPSVLKRCSSAPLINEAGAGPVPAAPPAHLHHLHLHHQPHQHHQPDTGNSAHQPRSPSYANMFSNSNTHRTRRFSASFSPLVQSTTTFMPRSKLRVSQLRQEECADLSNTREVAHEREIHSAMQMGQSWEDLSLMNCGLGNSPTQMSPTRNRFSPAVSPSPTRRSYTTRRSLSPIAIRASCFSPVGRPSLLGSIKRRIEDGDSPSSKRMCPNSDRLTPSTPGTPDSDSPIDCTFRPVSPRTPTMQESNDSREENHKRPNPS